jgi:guanylate kinase
MPPFKRKMLILIGAIGVGREAIAKRLIATVKIHIKSKNNELKMKHPEQFGRPRPDTTRQDISADKYNLKSQDEINLALAQREYVEFGQYDGHFFGTRMKSIQDVISQNKICVLDTNPWVRLLITIC